MIYNDDVVFALMLLRSHPDSTRPHESSKTMQNLKLSLSQTAWAKNVWSHTQIEMQAITHTQIEMQVRDSSVPESYQLWKKKPFSLGNQLQTWDWPPLLR